MDREQELADLIAEQRKEMHYGRRVYPEFNGSVSLDYLREKGIEPNSLGVLPKNKYGIRNAQTRTSRHHAGKLPRPGTRCKRHGPEDKRRTPEGKAYCAGCNRDRLAAWRLANPSKRVRRERCVHGHAKKDYVHRPDGGWRCRACERIRHRKYREQRRRER